MRRSLRGWLAKLVSVQYSKSLVDYGDSLLRRLQWDYSDSLLSPWSLGSHSTSSIWTPRPFSQALSRVLLSARNEPRFLRQIVIDYKTVTLIDDFRALRDIAAWMRKNAILNAESLSSRSGGRRHDRHRPHPTEERRQHPDRRAHHATPPP